MSVQLTSPTIIRAAKVTFGQQLSWDLEALERECGRLAKAIAAATGTTPSTGTTTGIRTVSVSTNVTASDYTILCDATAGAITVTLPPGPAKGRILNVSKIDAGGNAVTLAGNGWNINGAPTTAIHTVNVNIQVQFSGTEWRILSRNPLLLETNSVENGRQTLLNLVAGPNISLADDGLGDVTIASTLAIRKVTANYTVVRADFTVEADATSSAFTVTLPLAPDLGEYHNVKKVDSTLHIVTLAGNGKLIDGAASIDIIMSEWSFGLQYDGASWAIL